MRVLFVIYVLTLIYSTVKGAWVECDVTSADFGAKGDGTTYDTDAIRKALESCNVVLLPAGHTFLTGPLNITSNQVFQVS